MRNSLASIALTLLVSGAAGLFAQTLNLYTKPTNAPGGIKGRVDVPLTHALALHRDRKQCFRATLSEGNQAFSFTGLPTGKYDLVLVTASGEVHEGLYLGEKLELDATRQKNLETRLGKQDKFFNKWQLHRAGIVQDAQGEDMVLALVERMRDTTILRHSGEQLMSNLRRLEVVDLTRSTDDWTQTEARHIYREEAPLGKGMSAFRHRHQPELGNVRVIDAVKDLGTLALK